jgi:hypothetical protein
MPIMQVLLLKVPSPVLGAIIISFAVAFSAVGILFVRRLVHHSKLKTHHDVVDPILGAAVALYAVLTAFVVIMVWQNFDKANSNVQLEANYLADIYRDSEAFSPEFHQKTGDLLREYRQAVIDHEWKTMREGNMSPEVETLMRKIWRNYTDYQPKTVTEQAFFIESVRKLNSFRELRRQRIMESRIGIPGLLWLVLIIGGISTISFTFFFGAENIKVQLAISMLLAVTISLILFTILALDFPFTGDIAVPSDPFKMVLLD